MMYLEDFVESVETLPQVSESLMNELHHNHLFVSLTHLSLTHSLPQSLTHSIPRLPYLPCSLTDASARCVVASDVQPLHCKGSALGLCALVSLPLHPCPLTQVADGGIPPTRHPIPSICPSLVSLAARSLIHSLTHSLMRSLARSFARRCGQDMKHYHSHMRSLDLKVSTTYELCNKKFKKLCSVAPQLSPAQIDAAYADIKSVRVPLPLPRLITTVTATGTSHHHC
jgi:hypothetical protein